MKTATTGITVDSDVTRSSSHALRRSISRQGRDDTDMDSNMDSNIDLDIDMESKQMFESNERRLKFLEQEIVRLSKTLNRPLLTAAVDKTPNHSCDGYAVRK